MKKSGQIRQYIRLVALIKPYWLLLLAGIFFMVITALFDGLSLTALVPLVDKILAGKEITLPDNRFPGFVVSLLGKINAIPRGRLLGYIAIFIVAVYLIKSFSFFMQRFLMSKLGQLIVKDLRDKLFEKIQHLPLKYINKVRSGELISRVLQDVALLENSIAYGVTEFVYESGQLIVFFIIICFIFGKTALIFGLITPLVLIPMMNIGKQVKKLTKKTQETVADVNSVLFEALSGIKVIKAFNAQDPVINNFRASNKKYYRYGIKTIFKKTIVSPTLEFVSAVIAALVLYYGGLHVLKGSISFGFFSLFIASLLSLIRPLKRISNVYTFNQQALAAAERIFEVLDIEPENIRCAGLPPLPDVKNGIEIKDVSFAYEDKPVLRGINIKIPKGKKIALVGPSGSGKSTIVNLLLRFYDPASGAIEIDGVDVRSYSISSLRKRIGLVSQETVLFKDTVRNNISLGSDAVGFEKVIAAARLAMADEFIRTMPDGYDTDLGNLGHKLSGGQRQRIAIARALLKEPDILIFDEATSHLDTQSEKQVQAAIEAISKDKTVVIVAHRLSTVMNADNIYVLSHGSVVEEGTHEELMAKKGLYYSLFMVQQVEEA